jgi:hypothetical protein
MSGQKMKTRRASSWKCLEWEGQALRAKMLGILGTLGILSLFLGKYGHFSRVPKSANGTLETGVSLRQAQANEEVEQKKTKVAKDFELWASCDAKPLWSKR